MGTYNCEVFVFFPLFAIEMTPRPSCVSGESSSSSKGLFQMLVPPLPVPVGSPPWICHSSSFESAMRYLDHLSSVETEKGRTMKFRIFR